MVAMVVLNYKQTNNISEVLVLSVSRSTDWDSSHDFC